MNARSLLFVPGNRPERFAKAAAAGADLVCIDLEDAVGPAEKDTARAATCEYLKSASAHIGVRTNPARTDLGRADMVALAGLDLPFIMLPKADAPEDIAPAAAALSCPLIPVIESAKALLSVEAIFAMDRVEAAVFGAVDYSADLDCERTWEALLWARSKLAAAGAAHDVLVFDVPYLDVRDADGCEAETRRSKSLGLHARTAIHPAQIEPLHRALSPSPDEIAHAKRLIAAYQEAGGDVALMDGQLIEAPLMRKARRILSRKG